LRIVLIALVVLSVAIAITASALNAISQSETESRRNDLTHGSTAKFHYGIAHVAMPKGNKTFPPELVPVD
jgi:hypothetical protein